MLAEAIKKQTEAAQKQLKAEKQAADDLKLKVADEDCRKGQQAARDEMPARLKLIVEAANNGKNSINISITSWSRSPDLSPYKLGYLNELKRLFKNDGFTVEERNSRTDPCGSDPLFYHTTYDTDLEVSW